MNRNEFETKLNAIFSFTNKYTTQDWIIASIDNNTEKLTEIRNYKNFMDNQKNAYLSAFDAAENDEQKLAVIGSVVVNYEI